MRAADQLDAQLMEKRFVRLFGAPVVEPVAGHPEEEFAVGPILPGMKTPGEKTRPFRQVIVNRKRVERSPGQHFMGFSRGVPADAEPVEKIVGPVEKAHPGGGGDNDARHPGNHDRLDHVPFGAGVGCPGWRHLQLGQETILELAEGGQANDGLAGGGSERFGLDDGKILRPVRHPAEIMLEFRGREARRADGIVGEVGVGPVDVLFVEGRFPGRRIFPIIDDDHPGLGRQRRGQKTYQRQKNAIDQAQVSSHCLPSSIHSRWIYDIWVNI